MKSGLGDRNNLMLTPAVSIDSIDVSMKSGLGDLNQAE